jgi:NAD(P)-dependent dehydrogenase (short-subunit alcohol dehydrogenase family)
VKPTCPIRKVFKGQKALETGANSGIGKGIAVALAHAGANVAFNFRFNPESAQEVVREASHYRWNGELKWKEVQGEKLMRQGIEKLLVEKEPRP